MGRFGAIRANTMKFSFELSRAAAQKQPLTGSVIRSATARPRDAEILRTIGDRVTRMYDAAMTNNLNGDFSTTVGSANAEILTSLYLARGRSRTLVKDNPYAKGIVRTMRNNIVGHDPFRLEMKVGKKDAKGKFTPETETNEKIQAAWKKAGSKKNCTVRKDMSRLEMYHAVIASVVRDGSLLARHHRSFPNNSFGYAIELIDIDRLQESYMGKSQDGNVIRFSIERDRFNAPVKYWILTRHPGDLFQTNPPASNVMREGVDAENIIHFNNIRERPEQDVGFPELDSIIQRLHRIDQFDIAHVTAAIYSACKSIWIERVAPTANEYQADGESREGQKLSNVEPSTAEILPDGYQAKQLDPKFPLETGPDFKKDQLRGVGAGSGVAYHTLANDLSSVNFSSGRLGENAQRDEFMVRQELMIEDFVRLHFNEWLKYAILSGEVELPLSRLEEFQEAAEFNGRRWSYINPLQDAQADVLRIEAGLDSRDNVIINSERGGDVETVNAEIANGKDSDEEFGLDFSGADPTLPTVKKGEPGQEMPAPNTPATPPRTGAKQTLRVDFERLERSWNAIVESEPSEENKEGLKQLLEWKGRRNGQLH